jgi:septal ring factor EnvC (AmiA/AmiB activator)
MRRHGPEGCVNEKDSLDRIAALAADEGALDRRKLRGFLDALRDRARRVLEERVEPLAKRADAFEKESRWRAEVQAGLEAELAWRAEEVETLRAEAGRLKTEIEALREEWRTASAVHDRLLAHHRSVVAGVAGALETVIPWLPWSYKRARARIAELAATLRKELS